MEYLLKLIVLGIMRVGMGLGLGLGLCCKGFVFLSFFFFLFFGRVVDEATFLVATIDGNQFHL